jgi:hypothetical protein
MKVKTTTRFVRLFVGSRFNRFRFWFLVINVTIKQLEYVYVCVLYCRTYYKAVRVGGEESGGHVL